MTNRKEILLETLRGSVKGLKVIPDLLDGIDVYTEDGYVDTDFLTSALVCVNDFMDTSNLVVSSISSLLAPDVPQPDKKSCKNRDDGQQWSVEEILRHCVLEDNVMKLPDVKFGKKSYAEAKKWIEEAGGSWNGGKVQGFTFPFDAARVFGILHEGRRCNLQQDFQFFETPASVADRLVMLAGGVHEGETVLEPSAGRGALARAIHRTCPNVSVDCYELMPENREFLKKMEGIRLIGEDFTKEAGACRYKKIIANPPFSNNQDVKHIRMMYDLLEEGGTLAAITSMHWKFGSEKTCSDFREWLESVGGEVHEIEEGEFRESGTNIATLMVIIHRRIKQNKQLKPKIL